MTAKEFLRASNKLKKFIKEQEKLNDVLKVISPSSTGVVEFGNEFIDDYIQVVEIALGDEYNWFSWFVFENDFGSKKLTVEVDGKEYMILDEQQFFNVVGQSEQLARKSCHHACSPSDFYKGGKCDKMGCYEG